MRAGGLCGLLCCLPMVASAWDAGGHMLVGQIAWDAAKPEVREKASTLLVTLENTYNENQPYNFVTAGCWMDDMRSKKGYAWSKLHFVTIPYTPSGTPCEIPVEGPHVVSAIHENVKALRNPATTPADAAQALAMVMHFVGDLHQPLHATDRGDRGGNGFLITGVPFTDLWPGTIANLHAFWDKAFRFDRGESRIVETWACPTVLDRPKAPGEGVIGEQAAKIANAFPTRALPQLEEARSVESWTRESHTIGCLAGYPSGPMPSNAEVMQLTPHFAEQAGQIAQQRVALAGYRLARLLNEIFAPEPSATK